MYASKITPIRTCVGRVLPINSVKMIELSTKANGFQYDLKRLVRLADCENLDFSSYQPSGIHINGVNYPPISGSSSYRLPAPENLPFSPEDNGFSLHGLLPEKNEATSRDLWIELEIKFGEKQLVGGISFSGFPHLMYQINNQGETSANFGLPREIRIRWNDGQSVFLDDENVIIRQEPVSHSGVHYITFGPVVTDKLIIRFADWPQFLTRVKQMKSEKTKEDEKEPLTKDEKESAETTVEPGKTPEVKKKGYEKKKIPQKDESEIVADDKRYPNPDQDCKDEIDPGNLPTKDSCDPYPQYQYGLILPFITAFEYKESVNYRAHLPIGLLACTKTPGLDTKSHFCIRPVERSESDSLNWNADYLYYMKSPQPRFVKFSATSCIDQSRKYSVDNVKFPEYFISSPFSTGESINMYIEQAHDNGRCCSGLKLKLPEKIMDGFLPRTKMIIKIYEIDIIEGLSPLMISRSVEKQKYLTLLCDEVIPVSGYQFTFKFLRASLSKYFLICFENEQKDTRKNRNCQLAVEHIEFIQSAHVSITTRAAHNVIVDSIHFRLIGENLGEDYAKLGSDAFSINVESMSGGQRNSVLFSANNLLELLSTGNTRIYANMRREEVLVDVSKENSETLEGSFDEHTSLVNNENWKKTETGEDVKWEPMLDNNLTSSHRLIGKAFAKSHKGEFENFSSAEIRTYNELIGHEGAAAYGGRIRDLLNLLFRGTGITFPENLFTEDPRLLRRDNNNFDWKNKIWNKGFDTSDDQFWVSELRSLVLPPWFAGMTTSTLDDIKNMFENIASLIQHGGLPNMPDMNAYINFLNAFTPFGLINGLAIGGSLSVQAVAGLSVSSSTAQLLPSMNYNSTSGTSGSISKQANKTGYAYSQFLTSGQDVTRSLTEYDKGVMNRKVKRELNQPGTIKARRKGAEIMWQGKVMDIVTGKIPLGISLPATGNNYYQNTDLSIRVKLSGYSTDIEADVWFEVIEDSIREDY